MIEVFVPETRYTAEGLPMEEKIAKARCELWDCSLCGQRVEASQHYFEHPTEGYLYHLECLIA